jgi:haloalkane dehalogenase
MTALTDLALIKVAVLDSTMAYREAGRPDSPAVLFLHGNLSGALPYAGVAPAHVALPK